MKRTVILMLLFLTATSLAAQHLFVEVGGGMMNYGRDLQDKLFTFNQANSALSAGVGYRFSDYFSVTASLLRGKLAASDAKTNPERYRRNLSFYTNITEGSARLSFNLRAVPSTFKFTPYAFAGIGIYHFNPYTFYQGNKVYLQPLSTEGEGLPEYPGRKTYKLTQFTIPFGGGLTYALSEKIMASAELGFRKLFTDYLDDVSATYADTAILRTEVGDLSAKMSFRSDETNDPLPFSLKTLRGNPNRKDVYYSALIKVSFTLGSGSAGTDWYSRKAHKKCGCPGKVL